jgi:cold shock CspA family protein
VKGECVSYDRAHGFGFVISTENPDMPNFFVHCSFIEGRKPLRFLRVGQQVEFTPAAVDTDRPQAHNVKKFPITVAIQRSAAPGTRP